MTRGPQITTFLVGVTGVWAAIVVDYLYLGYLLGYYTGATAGSRHKLAFLKLLRRGLILR